MVVSMHDPDVNPLYLSGNRIGYTAAKGDGTYYFYGPDNVLYNDAYSGEVRASDMQANAVGMAPTYDFSVGDNQVPTLGTIFA